MVLTGTVIGGGFASGREIGTYFLRYGEKTVWSMAVFAAVFFILCFKISCICKKENITTADEFFKYVFRKTQALNSMYFPVFNRAFN